MMIMNGSADQGLIVHELGHNYTMGILANNEWREGWLGEGVTSFQTTWVLETQGKTGSYEQNEASMLSLDLDGYSEPASLVSQGYRDFTSYNLSIYSRGELFFHQLRYLVGDATMHRILQTFYERWKLRHVDEAAFRAVAEEVSHQDLSTLFAQGLHTTELYDYAVGKVKADRRTAGQADGTAGSWTTRVEVLRKGEGRIPVEVAVIAERDTAVVRAEGLAEREWVEVETRSKPTTVIPDPRVRSHDSNMLNNRKRLGWFSPRSLLPPPGTDWYIHPYFSTRSRRDRLTVGVQPTVWYNDAGGITLGIRSRDDYLGRFEQNQALVSVSTGWGVDDDVRKVDVFVRARNPVFLRAPNVSQTFDAYKIEGRYGAVGTIQWSRRAHLTFGPTWNSSVRLQWVAPDDFRYLDRGLYDDAGTVELQLGSGVTTAAGETEASLRTSVAGGLAYNRGGLTASGRPDLDPFYFRGTIEGTARRRLLGGRLGIRAFAGVASGNHTAAKQRQ